jgi:hypothetical protein
LRLARIFLPADGLARRGKFRSCAVPSSRAARAERRLGHSIVAPQLPAAKTSCGGEAEAQKLIGSELAYSAQSFRWRNIRTRNPSATARTLTARQFYDENSGGGCNSSQVTFAQLGIKTDQVFELKISHPDASITGATSEIPGDSVLSRDKNTLIFSVCDIYFEAKRHAAVHK